MHLHDRTPFAAADALVPDGGDHLVAIGAVVLAEEGPGVGGLLYTPDGYDVWLPNGG